jgi:hypothetical protein
MVSREELIELFDYENGKLIGKHVPWRRKAANTRTCGRVLGSVISKSGHLSIRFQDKRGNKHAELVHRVIFMMHHGWLPEMLDHINRDPSDNRIENLRPACKSLNSQNRGPSSVTKHGMRGIYKDKLGGYCVYIGLGGKRIILGRTICIGKAWEMRKDAERRYWPNATGNEVPTP